MFTRSRNNTAPSKTDTQHVLEILMEINAICRNRSLHYVNDDSMAFLSSSTLAHSSYGLRLSSLGCSNWEFVIMHPGNELLQSSPTSTSAAHHLAQESNKSLPADMSVQFHFRLLVPMSLFASAPALLVRFFARAPRAASLCPSTVSSNSGSALCTHSDSPVCMCQFHMSCEFRFCCDSQMKCSCMVAASTIADSFLWANTSAPRIRSGLAVNREPIRHEGQTLFSFFFPIYLLCFRKSFA